VPKVVIIDPDLIRGTPRVLLLSSAIKGIDHAIEGMRQINPSHPHAVLAASGARRFLNTLWKWPKEMETEEALDAKLVKPDDLLQLQLAAWQSYFFPASVVYGLSHRIGHILGGTFGVPHSLTSCITLAPVLDACSEFYGKKLSQFTPVRSLLNSAVHLSEEIHSTVKSLGLPTRLRDVEIQQSDLETLAELLNVNYPKEVADLGDGAEKKLGDLLESIW
jgi:alcohol dehydrogenase class IV